MNTEHFEPFTNEPFDNELATHFETETEEMLDNWLESLRK